MFKITMVGTGYVGLVTGCGFADIGHRVICCDIDKQKIKSLKNNVIPIFEPGLSDIFKKNVNQKRLKFSSDVADSINKSDIIFDGTVLTIDSDRNHEIKTIKVGLANSEGCTEIMPKSNHLVAPFIGVPNIFKKNIVISEVMKIMRHNLLKFFKFKKEKKNITNIPNMKNKNCLLTK